MKSKIKCCLVHATGKIPFLIDENLVPYFHACVYNEIDDLAETIMNPSNCCSSTVILPTKGNLNFTHPEAVYVYTDLMKPNLVTDTYVQLLTSLYFPSDKGYHRFDYRFCKQEEQSFIEFISIRLVMKSGENVLLAVCDIPCLVILHFKKKSSAH